MTLYALSTFLKMIHSSLYKDHFKLKIYKTKIIYKYKYCMYLRRYKPFTIKKENQPQKEKYMNELLIKLNDN